MAIDISGKTFDPRHNYSELVSMQGRVVSDTPLNEGAAIVDRRFRAETIDLAGFNGYPAHLPDSFRIDISGGELLIHPGRYYVDGLMAENFGHGEHAFYLPLEEMRSDEPVPFGMQPYLPIMEPPELEDGRYLAFLDVWKRPVTFLEDPDLVDPAIGVDTSARMQTVWQVKLFTVDEGVTCNTDDEDIEGWEAFTAPSSARLSTRANPASAVEDPCLLPPEGGYRGLENRTYMVAVHDVNEDGVPLLKWSRVNGAFAGRILAQPANNMLSLDNVAKDDYMRFNDGDWVEITDDVRVLEGNPGTMVKIQKVYDAKNQIEFTAPLNVGEIILEPASTTANQSLHPILRRWDQSGVVLDTDGSEIVNLDAPGSDGLIPAPDGIFIALEDGVETAISLKDGTGEYHVSDNWSFVTRYANSSVETLTDAPPHAFHHHYSRLAIVDVSGGEFVEPVFQDCRDPIGTAGCCTVVVRPGEDIQTALDSLSPQFGGCVCLKVGMHTIRRPLRIRYPNVTLHGESHGVQIRNLSGESAIVVRSDDGSPLTGIHLSTLAILNRGSIEKPAGIIALRAVEDSRVQDCRVQALDGSVQSIDNPAVGLFDCQRVRISHCKLEGSPIGVWIGDGGEDLTINNNVMNFNAEQLPGLVGVAVTRITGRARVLDNDIDGFARGVVINNQPSGAAFSTASYSEVKGNRITLRPTPSDLEAIAVECYCAFGTVSENQILLLAEESTGVMVRGTGTLIERNRIETEAQIETQVAILVGGDEELFTGGITAAQNWINGCSGGVIAEKVAGLRVDNNDISGDRGTELAVSAAECTLVSIENNNMVGVTLAVFASECEDVQINSNQIRDNVGAIACVQCLRVDITNNQIYNSTHGGIVTLFCLARVGIVGNRLNHVGVSGSGVFASSIMSVFHLGECHIESNEVLNTGVGMDEGINPLRTVGIGALFVLEARVESNLVSYSDLLTRERVLEDRALLMQGLMEFSFPFSDRRFVLLGYACQVADNKFLGRGADTLVEILSRRINDNIRLRFERVLFNNNFIEHVGSNDDIIANGATVILNGSQASVMGNHVKSGTFFLPSFDFNGMEGPFIGNVVRGSVINHPEFPVPESGFNSQA